MGRKVSQGLVSQGSAKVRKGRKRIKKGMGKKGYELVPWNINQRRMKQGVGNKEIAYKHCMSSMLQDVMVFLRKMKKGKRGDIISHNVYMAHDPRANTLLMTGDRNEKVAFLEDTCRALSVPLRTLLVDGILPEIVLSPKFHSLGEQSSLAGDIHKSRVQIGVSEKGGPAQPLAYHERFIFPLYGVHYKKREKGKKLGGVRVFPARMFDLRSCPDIEMSSWLGSKIVSINGRDYTLRECLKFVANVGGGVHSSYPTSYPDTKSKVSKEDVIPVRNVLRVEQHKKHIDIFLHNSSTPVTRPLDKKTREWLRELEIFDMEIASFGSIMYAFLIVWCVSHYLLYQHAFSLAHSSEYWERLTSYDLKEFQNYFNHWSFPMMSFGTGLGLPFGISNTLYNSVHSGYYRYVVKSP